MKKFFLLFLSATCFMFSCRAKDENPSTLSASLRQSSQPTHEATAGTAGQALDKKEKTEQQEEQVKPASDEAALLETILTGLTIGGILYLLSRKCNFSKVSSGGAGVVGGGVGAALDAKFGFFPKKTRAAFVKLGVDVLQGKVSDPELFGKVCELSQDCAIALIKELIKTYGAGGAQEALGKLQNEVKRGHIHLQAVQDGPTPKRGLLFSGKINFEQLKVKKEEAASLLEKIEQTKQLVHFRKRFDDAQKMADHIQMKKRSNDLDQSEDLQELEKMRAELAREKKNLPFNCVQKEELDTFFGTQS